MVMSFRRNQFVSGSIVAARFATCGLVFGLLSACGGASDVTIVDPSDASDSGGAKGPGGPDGPKDGGHDGGVVSPPNDGGHDGSVVNPPSDAGSTLDADPTAAPGVCADACRQAHPNWQSGFNNLVMNNCACGGPGTACTTECETGFVCGGTASASDACIRCMSGALSAGGQCAQDGTFKQLCLSQADCGAFAKCIAACGAH
jgi:hypothetical protein